MKKLMSQITRRFYFKIGMQQKYILCNKKSTTGTPSRKIANEEI